MLYIGSDHGGFELKEFLIFKIKNTGRPYQDIGCYSSDAVDYPDISRKLADLMVEDSNSQGILLCGTGVGISIAANRFEHLRAALCFNEAMARKAREHNNANILVLGGRILGPEAAWSITISWFNTNFSGDDRHVRRILKINGAPEKE